LVCPIWATCIFLFFYNEPELGVEIDPGMALTPLPSSIGQGLNPRPSDHELSALPLDHSFCITSSFLICSAFRIQPCNLYQDFFSLTEMSLVILQC